MPRCYLISQIATGASRKALKRMQTAKRIAGYISNMPDSGPDVDVRHLIFFLTMLSELAHDECDQQIEITAHDKK